MSDREEPLPRGDSYRSRPWRRTPEHEAQVRRWIEQQDAVLKERLRRLRGETKP